MGTHEVDAGAEWEAAHKRSTCTLGKTGVQGETVMWTEIEVGKSESHVPRKAAIVHIVPVP